MAITFDGGLGTARPAPRLPAADQAARAQLQHLYDLTAALGATAAELCLHSARRVPPLQPEDNGLPVGTGGWTGLDRPSSSNSPLTREAADAVPLALSLEADRVHPGMLIVYGSNTSIVPEHVTAVARQITQASITGYQNR
jgi:hypothetical protein